MGEAYEILSDKDKRARYDQFGHAGVDPNYGAGAGGGFGGGFGGGVDLGDLFGDLFGGGFGGFGGGRRATPNAPRKGGDIRVSLVLSFMEAVHGCTKTVSVNRQDTCPECGGTGAAKGNQPRDMPGLPRLRLCDGAAAHAFWRDAKLAALLTLRRQGKDHQIPVLQVPRQRQDLQHKAC